MKKIKALPNRYNTLLNTINSLSIISGLLRLARILLPIELKTGPPPFINHGIQFEGREFEY